MTHSHHIFILGCGGVVQCTLPLIRNILSVPPQKITIMDFVDNKDRIAHFLKEGVTYVQEKLTPENYPHILATYLKAGDIFIDLAWNVDTVSLIEWCQNNGVIYINTSVEEWDPFKDRATTSPEQLTLYHRQMILKNKLARDGAQPTAIVDHGANPGLVSHFTKEALTKIAHKILHEKPRDERVKKLEVALQEKNFAHLAQLTGTKVIHISERDTQLTQVPKKVNEFVNTWSIEGFIEEGLAPSELGWGTHEKKLPQGAMTHNSGPQNQIYLSTMGVDTWMRSWVPSGPIIGMAIRHGEAFGISDRLTVWDQGVATYRPTVHYVYCPTDSALSSLHELAMRNYSPQEDRRILNDDIISGADEVGVLLMGHDFQSWWCGSILDITQARKLVPHQNSTTLQVAISIIAAIEYALKNPRKGLCLPDDIDHEEILKISKPYLGTFFCEAVNWNPLMVPDPFFVFGHDIPPAEDMWQFSTFAVKNNLYHK